MQLAISIDFDSYGAMARPAFSTMFSVILLTLHFVSLAASNCYCVRDNQIIDCSATETVCGNASSVDSGAQLCCVADDICGKDSICHFSKPIANTSGYYLGGCTDPTYKDPVCQKHCTDAGTADVVYNSTSQLWSCCGYPDNTVSCQNPRTDATFQAIALNDFPGTPAAAPSSTRASSSSTSSSASSSMSSSSATTATTATTATAGAASASRTVVVSQSSTGLSTGAIAGIAIAAVLIGLAIIAGLIFLFIRRGKRAASEADAAAAANMPGYFSAPTHNGGAAPGNAEGMSEIYTPNKDLNTTTNGYYDPRKPDALHESDNRAVPAQLYGSEPPVQELP